MSGLTEFGTTAVTLERGEADLDSVTTEQVLRMAEKAAGYALSPGLHQETSRDRAKSRLTQEVPQGANRLLDA